MGIQKLILNFVLKIEAFFVSFLKIKKNRITFISLETDHLTLDFKDVYDALNHNHYDIQLCLIHYQKNLWGQFLYFLNCLKQLYLVYTSRVVFLHDNNYVVSHFKRDGVQVIQLWHACGAIKKFGNLLDREYKIKNYDYVIANSDYWRIPYSQAFGVEENQVQTLGMPRVDHLFKEDWIHQQQQSLFEKYPMLKNKKIVLYAPTFRGNIYKGFRMIPINVTRILDSLGDDYVFLYKLHPLLGNQKITDDSRAFCMNLEDTHMLFTIADYLITDYSSIALDYMILENPLLFFVPDQEEYMSDVGTFIDLKDLNCPLCMNEDDIIDSINHMTFDQHHMKELKHQFFQHTDGHNVQRIVQLVDDLTRPE